MRRVTKGFVIFSPVVDAPLSMVHMAVDARTVPRLGLALGGGGVLGAAHVGVLQVLRERGIRPSIVAGTSAGAVIGAAYVRGRDVYEMEQFVTHASWRDFGKRPGKPGLGLADSSQLRDTVTRIGGEDCDIEDLPMPFAAVAADARTGELVVLRSGSLIDAVRASMSVPGLFVPPLVDGRQLVDGGLVQNLPLETVFEMGAEHAIGVRLAPEWDRRPAPRTAVLVHEWEIDRRVTMIYPRVGRRSQWRVRGLSTLVRLGREAAERALADYPIVAPRPPAPPTS
jgi:NTE family protein